MTTTATTTFVGPYGTKRARDDALRLAMWVFLASETLLFAGLFGLYAGYRAHYPAEFVIASRHNEEWIGSVNTLVLVTSSFFVAFAVHAVRSDRHRLAEGCLALVLVLGSVFLGLKGLEYAEHFRHGVFPGAYYASRELPGGAARTFFTLYFFTTGLHALHVIAGLVVMLVLLLRVHRGRTNRASHVELEMGGLYWHVVDVVWIFLWPLLYLVR